MCRYYLPLVTCYLLLALAGCATPVVQQPVELYWPPPPDPPKIKYLESWSTQDDFGKGGLTAFMETIIGKEEIANLRKPHAVAVDSGGRIYVTDTAHRAVAVIDKVSKKFWFIGVAGTGRLNVPVGIAIYEIGDRLFVADSKLDVVNVFRLNGSFVKSIGLKKEFENPVGIAIDSRLKRLYIVDSKKHKLFVFSLEGELIREIGDRGGDDGFFNFPVSVAVDSKGNIYVNDSGNFRVQVFDPDGKFLRKFGQLGDTFGCFARPKGIAIDSEDHIYVGDAAFNNFQIFDTEGRLLTWVGQAGFGPGEFQTPSGIFIDNEDRIYVVDQLNRRVQVFQYLGEKWKAKKP